MIKLYFLFGGLGWGILLPSNLNNYLSSIWLHNGLPWYSVGKESSCNAGDPGWIPGSGNSPGERTVYPLQYSDLENSTDCIVYGIAKSRRQLSLWLHNNEIDLYKFVVSDLLKSLLNTENNSKTCTMSQINTLLPVNFRRMWRELPKFTLHQSQRNRAWEVRKARTGFRTMNETISENLGMCIKTVLFWGKKKKESSYFESDSHFVHFNFFSKDVSV